MINCDIEIFVKPKPKSPVDFSIKRYDTRNLEGTPNGRKIRTFISGNCIVEIWLNDKLIKRVD